ncbi:MAG: DPP IV N-terminal domain-containing protein, partial [Enterobacterales bacterium]|nr:DPP IV N-terminal domain-containing protein [Enterobacterales bacterium]
SGVGYCVMKVSFKIVITQACHVCLLIVVPIAFLSISTNSLSAGMSLQQTIETKKVLSIAVSPNGEMVAYRLMIPHRVGVDDDGKSNIALYLINKQAQNIAFVSGLIRVGRVIWSRDSQQIYFLAQKNNDPYVSIYKISASGGEAKKIIAINEDIYDFTLSHDAQAISYLAKKAKSRQQDSYHKKGFNAQIYEESLVQNNIYLAILNRGKLPHISLENPFHLVNLKYHPSSRLLLARTVKTALIDDLYIASSYQILQQSGESISQIKLKGKLAEAHWSPDGKRVAIIAGADKKDPVAGRLFSIRLKNGRIHQLVKKYPGDIKQVHWISKNKLLAVAAKGTQSELIEIDVRKSNWVTRVSQEGLHLIAVDSDEKGKNIHLVASRSSHPAEIYRLHKKQLTRITHSNPWLDSIELPQQQSIQFKSKRWFRIARSTHLSVKL